MADFDKTYPFTTENIDNTFNEHGVYVLYDGSNIIYIGRAAGEGVTLRSRLRDHKNGRDGPCTRGASHYARERNSNSVAREKVLLENYRREHGKLPHCNDRVG